MPEFEECRLSPSGILILYFIPPIKDTVVTIPITSCHQNYITEPKPRQYLLGSEEWSLGHGQR